MLVLPWLDEPGASLPRVWSAGWSRSALASPQQCLPVSSAECKACYHKSCFKSTRCPRCERLQARRELLAKQSMESYVSDYEDELEQPETVAAT